MSIVKILTSMEYIKKRKPSKYPLQALEIKSNHRNTLKMMKTELYFDLEI